MASQLRFGPFRVDAESGALFLSGAKVAIQRQPFALLALLLERSGMVVTRDELRARIWPEGTFVDFERALNTTVRKLRRALSDSAVRPRFVETVPLRGYRFLAPVEEASAPAPNPVGGPATLVAEVADGGAPDEPRRRTLSDAVVANGADDHEWRDGRLVARFASSAAAVHAAIGLQRTAHPTRTGVRVGIDVARGSGADTDASFADATRLCTQAAARQILCAREVAQDLAGSAAFAFRALRSQGSDAAAFYEARCADEGRDARVERTSFVGRDPELLQLAGLLAQTETGRGGLAFVAGEAGIGKTRLLEEFANRARSMGAQVIAGVARDGELGPPFGPFAEALSAWVRDTDADTLRATLGRHASVLARIVPELHERLTDLAEPERLAADEERARLLDAIAQSLWQVAQRKTLVLLLDDLHWADGATLALLRHVGRFLTRQRVLVVGAYRDVELDRRHSLHDALAALVRDVPFERIDVRGLDRSQVAELLASMTRETVSTALLGAIERETRGNPFFVRELLLHLAEEGRLETLASARGAIDLGLPDRVRQVVGRRVARLSETASRLLAGASACDGAFRFSVVAAATDLDEHAALDALDEALDAQLVEATDDPEVYEFGHALIRHALYGEINPSRRLRLHRRLAERLAAEADPSDADTAFEIARHYALSAALPGAERGAAAAIAAADGADRALAFERSEAALRMAEALLAPDDARRPRIHARLGLALARTGAHDEAFSVVRAAAQMLAASEGGDAAADYLAEAAALVGGTEKGAPRAWPLSGEALSYIGPRRDATWAYLMLFDVERRESAENAELGIMLDFPERRETARIFERTWRDARDSQREFSLLVFADTVRHVESRRQVLEEWAHDGAALAFWAGEFRHALERLEPAIATALRRGRLGMVSGYLEISAQMHASLGEFAAADRALERSAEFAERNATSHRRRPSAGLELAWCRGNADHVIAPAIEAFVAENRPEERRNFAASRAAAALGHALAGNRDAAERLIAQVVPAADRILVWDPSCTSFLCYAARVLWELDLVDHAATFERNIRAKTLAADFRYPQVDSRLALAQLAALTGRHDEARAWFDRARAVLDEQGARPLRAIVDYDEARAIQRRGARAERARARALLAAASAQFEAIGMPGWMRRADLLARELA